MRAGPGAVHLPAPGRVPECTEALLDRKVTGVAYETVELPDRSLPLLAPMSEVAGRMAPQVGAPLPRCAAGGGRGVLMGGVSGVYAAKVVVIGAGVSGMNAAAIALGMQAEVLLLDKNIARLREADAIYQGHMQTVASNAYEIERAVLDADLVIGAVLVPGAKAPTLVTDELVAPDEAGQRAGRHLDRPGRLLRVDPADDARRPDVPGPRLAVLLRGQHAGRGAAHLDLRADQRHAAVRRGDRQPGLARGRAATTRRWRSGVNTHDGHVVYGPVAEAHGLPLLTAGRGLTPDGEVRADRRRGGAVRRLRSSRGSLPRPPGGRARAGREHARRPTGATCAGTSAALAGRLDDLAEVTTEADVADFLAGLRDGDADHPPLGAGSRRPGRSSPCAACTGSRCARAWPPSTRRRRGRAAGAAPAAAQGDRGRGGRAAARGGRLRPDAAGAARPGAARAALRHRGPDLRGGRPGRRRPRPGPGAGPAARQGRQGAAGAGRLVRPARPLEAYLVRGRPVLAAAGRGTAAVFLNARGGRLSRQSAWTVLRAAADQAGLPVGPPRRTRCGTPSPPTCSTAAPTSASCRSCSGTPR